MNKEKELILLSSVINKTNDEIEKVDDLLNEKDIDWIEIAGIIMNHRLGGYFYKGLTEEQQRKMPKELRKNLSMLVEGQTVTQERLYKYIKELKEVLENQNVRYAGLKGIIYGACLYTKGIRRSNDMDLLVYEEDLEKLDILLRKVGYIQANKIDGKLVEATRKQKLIQRMNYHDLVPYMKETNDGIIEIDINFLIDGKDNLIDEKVFEIGTRIYEGENYSFRGLNIDTNLAFLICHFYREATGELWVNNRRNLVLYKIVDIVNYIRYFEKQMDVASVVKLFEQLNILEKALYSFLTIKKFYNIDFINMCIVYISSNYSEIYKKYESDNEFEQYFIDSFNLGR